jgi:hypothetical protein
VPVIVGSVAGLAAVIIIVATTIICFRRRRRNNQELSFDTLQGINASGAASRQHASQRYTTSPLPAAAGRASMTTAGYDDGYDYDTPSNVATSQGYGSHGVYSHDSVYDPYGTPQHAYQNPSIFQEDSLAYSSPMGRSRIGYDQNLPEIVYRNGNDLNDPNADGATGYYDDNMYNQQAGWNQNMSGGYIGPKGLWVANPTTENQYQQEYYPEQQADIELQQQQQQQQTQSRMSYEKNSVNQNDNFSDTDVGSSSSPQSKFRGHNPQALPASPRLQQLRSGDLFGQDSNTAPTSPRSAAAVAAAGMPASGSPQEGSGSTPPPLNSSPRLMSRGEMRSFELARHSSPRSSGEGVQSYATDYAAGRVSVSDRPSMDNGSSNLNPNKSLRTQRREDWS